MRQVPSFLLIGNGRVATHFRHYFTLLNLSFSSWHRNQPIDLLTARLEKATHVIVLITDKAINDFIQTYKNTALWIHFSGSLNTDLAFGSHPLMTFSHQLYTLEKYHTIPFIIDADAPEFCDLLPGLPNPHVRLDKSLKTKYHALCVLSGNFSCLLWQKFFAELEKTFHIPPEFGHPYLLQQTENLLEDPFNVLTGPLVRGDTMTIANHLSALKSDSFLEIYQSFVASYQKIKQELSHECT